MGLEADTLEKLQKYVNIMKPIKINTHWYQRCFQTHFASESGISLCVIALCIQRWVRLGIRHTRLYLIHTLLFLFLQPDLLSFREQMLLRMDFYPKLSLCEQLVGF